MTNKPVQYPTSLRWFNDAGILHREDGPAVEWNNGSKEWYFNGKRHRLDGPAVERFNGHKEWWFENSHDSFEIDRWRIKVVQSVLNCGKAQALSIIEMFQKEKYD